MSRFPEHQKYNPTISLVKNMKILGQIADSSILSDKETVAKIEEFLDDGLVLDTENRCHINFSKRH